MWKFLVLFTPDLKFAEVCAALLSAVVKPQTDYIMLDANTVSEMICSWCHSFIALIVRENTKIVTVCFLFCFWWHYVLLKRWCYDVVNSPLLLKQWTITLQHSHIARLCSCFVIIYFVVWCSFCFHCKKNDNSAHSTSFTGSWTFSSIYIYQIVTLILAQWNNPISDKLGGTRKKTNIYDAWKISSYLFKTEMHSL